MRIVFMGTTDFSAVILEELIQHHDVVAVYTRPDAVRSRGKQASPSPVKEMALSYHLEVRTPKTLRDEAEQAALAALAPDVICVAAYGALLPAEVLDLPRFCCLNVHASLLPRWRGAAPIERAILAGDKETGVCIMRMEEGLDTGPWCVCRTDAVADKTAQRLSEELASLGAQALLTALVFVEQGSVDWVYQQDESATYADKIGKGELNLDPAVSAEANARRVRASGPAHPARCTVAGKRAIITKARCVSEEDVALGGTCPASSGTAVFRAKRLLLGCAGGWLEVESLKPDGKREMAAADFVAGVPALRSQASSWEVSRDEAR